MIKRLFNFTPSQWLELIAIVAVCYVGYEAIRIFYMMEEFSNG